ncbi:MAG: response regulator transcription factor [Hyphomonadaceae bacterium]|nr:response regulator transcription factor [Hyphomonadaceae bacterium]
MSRINHNICIVDDDPAVLDSLTLMLETIGCTVTSFPDGTSFLNSDLKNFRGCVLLDVRMPGKDGMSVLREALAINPLLQVVMISGHGDIAMAVKALKDGAQDFIEKPFKADIIIPALDRACEKLTAERSDKAFEVEAKENLARLTERELQVLERLVDGKPNKIVAFELSISIRTVETHRARILQKTRANSIAELVKMKIAADGHG